MDDTSSQPAEEDSQEKLVAEVPYSATGSLRGKLKIGLGGLMPAVPKDDDAVSISGKQKAVAPGVYRTAIPSGLSERNHNR